MEDVKTPQPVAVAPSPVGTRSEKGQFLTGNPGGPGNPNRGKIEKLRHKLLEATDEDQIARIWQRALDLAELGDKDARKFVFDRLFGKVAQPILPAGNGPHSARLIQILFGITGTPGGEGDAAKRPAADPELLLKMNELAKLLANSSGETTEPERA